MLDEKAIPQMTSNNYYVKSEAFQQEIMAWSTPLLIRELAVYADLAELMIEGIATIPATGNAERGDQEAVIVTLMVRLLNDCEAAKRLTLIALPEQGYAHLRDVIETGGLLSLFLLDQKRALRWLSKLGEYSAGSVNAELKKHGIIWQGYSHYGALSHLTHPNLLAMVTTIKETNVADGKFLREFHVGGWKNEHWIRQGMHAVIVLMMLALHEHVAPVVFQYSDNAEAWWDRLREMIPKVESLGIGVHDVSDPKQTSPEYDEARKWMNRRLRLDTPLFRRSWVTDEESPSP